MSVAIIVIFNPLIIKETLGNPQHFILSAISNTRTHTHLPQDKPWLALKTLHYCLFFWSQFSDNRNTRKGQWQITEFHFFDTNPAVVSFQSTKTLQFLVWRRLTWEITHFIIKSSNRTNLICHKQLNKQEVSSQTPEVLTNWQKIPAFPVRPTSTALHIVLIFSFPGHLNIIFNVGFI